MNQLLSIQIAAQAVDFEYQSKRLSTGIFKTAIDADGIFVSALGLTGDVQVDKKNHGGLDKAVYVYSEDNYAWWREALAQPALGAGHFGENLTVSGLSDEAVCIGDVFSLGEAVFQVTQPRVPCFKLGVRMADGHFPKRFHRSGRVGFYWRVLQTGRIHRSDAILRMQADPAGISIARAMQALVAGPEQQQIRQQLLAVPALSAAWRADFQGS